MRRRWIVLGALTVLATSCGVLPGTSSDDDGGGVVTGVTPGTSTPIPTQTPIPTPTSRPTPTPRPTATPLPTPTPTPAITDSYTASVAEVRALFSSSDPEAGIGALVPLPFALPIPADAELERVNLEYGRWDFRENITGSFPPVDQAASVTVVVAYQTEEEVDALRAQYEAILLPLGYTVLFDQSEPGSFADTQYGLNGGFTQARGPDGEAQVSIFRQGDRNFVQVSLSVELTSDVGPPLLAWPTLLTPPLSGGFTYVDVEATRQDDGIVVVNNADWTFGVRTTNTGATLQTIADAYPVNNITLGEPNAGPADSPAVVEMSHPTGAEGSITVNLVIDATQIDYVLVSLPG